MLKRSYDRALMTTYSFGPINFASFGGNNSIAIQVPDGASWFRVEDLHVNGVVLFTNVTTGAHVQLGITGTLTKFIDLTLAALAAGACFGLRDQAAAVKADAGNGAPLKGVNVGSTGENVTFLVMTLTAPTGGTPAGTGHIQVSLAWWS